MEWSDAKDLLLTGILGVLGAILMSEVRKLRESVEQLNVNVAVIVSRTDNHESRIAKLEDRTSS